MTVRSILNAKGADVATIDPRASLADAAHMLAARRIGAIVVKGPANSVAGILSERDIVRAVSTYGAASLDRTVDETMTREVVTCEAKDSINAVMEKMTAGKFRHVPVVDHNKLVGIISIGDVVKARLAQMESETRALQDYVAGS
ncbi:MAG: CBS domain-containing protein [Alphaproteobacteria bacterium]|jgi:CBS domain-containing protein